jgi:hypothetical protein
MHIKLQVKHIEKYENPWRDSNRWSSITEAAGLPRRHVKSMLTFLPIFPLRWVLWIYINGENVRNINTFSFNLTILPLRNLD